MSATQFSEALKRSVRRGNLESQKVSTFGLVLEAIAESRWSDASELAEFFVTEAKVCWDLYRQWEKDLRVYLSRRGVSDFDLGELRAELAKITVLPDGTMFDPEALWDAFQTEIRAVRSACEVEKATEAKAAMTRAKELWRQTHDRDVDTVYGYVSEVSERFGEESVRDMWVEIMQPWFDARYDRFDIDTFDWSESLDVLLYLTFEAMRGHLVGPNRTGDIGFEELEDRFVFTFDPCGSGGRTVQGDDIEGTGPRMEHPYNWKTTEEAHDWNHFTPGVCLYCAHCIILTEQMPIDKFGYPVRVIDPPVYDSAHPGPQQCKWTVFKDPTTVPEELYERAGRRKPDQFGSSGLNGQKIFIGDITVRDPD